MVRPVEISLNIQHAADMARINTTENQARPEAAAQFLADRMEKQTRHQQEIVIRGDDTENTGINPDQRGHNQYNPQRRRAKKKSNDKKSASTYATGHLLDVKI